MQSLCGGACSKICPEKTVVTAIIQHSLLSRDHMTRSVVLLVVVEPLCDARPSKQTLLLARGKGEVGLVLAVMTVSERERSIMLSDRNTRYFTTRREALRRNTAFQT